MMDPISTPDASDTGTGGTDDTQSSAGVLDDHSQDQPTNSADSTQDGNVNNDKPTQPSDGAEQPKPGEPDAGTTADDAQAPKLDNDLDEWAEKSGRGKPETDRERQLLQDIRNGQRALTQDRQAKKQADELNKTVQTAAPKADGDDDDELDPLAKDVAALKADLENTRAYQARSDYYSVENVTPEESKAMEDILKEKVENGLTPEEFKVFTDPKNISDWHTLAKSRLAQGVDTSEIEQQAAAKERERLAKKQQAQNPNSSANSTSPEDASEDAARLKRFSDWD